MYTQIIKAQQLHVHDFANLVLMTGKEFLESVFGKQVKKVIEKLFVQKRNLFSYECTWFGLIEDEVFGVIVGYSYDYAKKYRVNTGRLILKEIGFYKLFNLIKIDNVLGRHSKGEFYLSNIAIYPKFRSMGLAKKLIEYVFEIAKQQRCEKVVLDVEKQNEVAKALYRKVGFEKVDEKMIRFGHNEFYFERMSFEILL